MNLRQLYILNHIGFPWHFQGSFPTKLFGHLHKIDLSEGPKLYTVFDNFPRGIPLAKAQVYNKKRFAFRPLFRVA